MLKTTLFYRNRSVLQMETHPISDNLREEIMALLKNRPEGLSPYDLASMYRNTYHRPFPLMEFKDIDDFCRNGLPGNSFCMSTKTASVNLPNKRQVGRLEVHVIQKIQYLLSLAPDGIQEMHLNELMWEKFGIVIDPAQYNCFSLRGLLSRHKDFFVFDANFKLHAVKEGKKPNETAIEERYAYDENMLIQLDAGKKYRVAWTVIRGPACIWFNRRSDIQHICKLMLKMNSHYAGKLEEFRDEIRAVNRNSLVVVHKVATFFLKKKNYVEPKKAVLI